MESKKDLITYRVRRAKETLEDAEILAEHRKWNSCINRLYYACCYAVTALLLKNDLKTITHNGAKSAFSENFIKNNIIRKDLGKIYSRFSHGGKKVIMMIYLIFPKKKFCLISHLSES